MLALNEIYKKISSDMYVKRTEVLNGADALQKETWDASDCSIGTGMRAVHFSHKAVLEGKQAHRGAVHRATIARKFLNMWRATCERSSVNDA